MFKNKKLIACGSRTAAVVEKTEIYEAEAFAEQVYRTFQENFFTEKDIEQKI